MISTCHPAFAAAAFASSVEASARRFAFVPNKDKWVAEMVGTARSEGSMPLATYVAHDAAGHAWKVP